ncbi:MAG: DeoR/GlpR family DNA-binding transcription regulator [Oscillospiraceae bacterium]|nr:DeoR/GlpR family DNA-binding transcription regulator [Oscillospiraceae bacterium]MDD4414295.1 DeoR/GlpR family DNA-binding transcription regulator [Oscillospiraceae bacterium]
MDNINIDITLQERRSRILEMLHNSGKVRVNELSALFKVSEVSIRNDLTELENQGLLSRVHGGAVSSYNSYYNMSLAQRSNTNRKEKEEIAVKISDMIHDNQSVMMNAGTTTLAVMNKLTRKSGITIITNSIVLALEGAKHKNLNIILLGGDVDYEYQFVYGTIALKQLNEFYVDNLILSADGIDAENGISTYYYQEAEICRQMIKQSKTVIAALDYTKIGRMTLRSIADAGSVNYVVTNANASEQVLNELKDKGINIVIA